MEYTVESYGALCSLCTFVVNGIKAREEDFVDKFDHDRENAPDYGCGDMKADVIPHTQEVLNKYGITEEEYYEIAQKVSEEVSFGRCGWCI